jgi:hypothetical protein
MSVYQKSMNRVTYSCLFLWLMQSCGPYIPVQEPAYSANRASAVETPEVLLSVQHLHNQFNHFVFDIEITNQGSLDVPFQPHHHISYYASSRSFPKHDHQHDIHAQSLSHSRILSKRLYARSPDLVVQMVDQKLKNRATAQAVFALVGVGLVVYDAVKDSEDNRKETWTYADSRKAASREAAIAGAFIASDVAGASADQAAAEAHFLPHEVFPDITLAPGARQRGKIFLPIENNYRFLRLVVSLPQGDYVFDFKRQGTQK